MDAFDFFVQMGLMGQPHSVLYFTWKWLPERAKMPHICAT